MNKGDDAQFPLFLNNGTRSNPIRYEFDPSDGCKIYFYILPCYESYDKYILKKTFCSNGAVITERPGTQPETYTTININDNKDIVIQLYENDTIDIPAGHYKYVIRATVKSDKINSNNLIKENSYMTLQVSNVYDFYLLDDDINRAW